MALNTYKASIYNFLFNSINAIVVIVNGIVMVPIYFHYMSVSTYGAWLASGNVVALLGLLESGLSFVVTQKLAAALSENEMSRFRKLAGSNILSALLISIIIFTAGIIIAPYISDIIHVEDSVRADITYAFIISVVASCISISVSLLGAFSQVWQETKQVGIFNTLSSLIAIASIMIFLWIGLGVVSIALSYLVRSSINLLLYSVWSIKKWKEKQYDSPLYSIRATLSLTKDCFYPLLSKVSTTLVLNSQGLLIAHFINPTATAIFDLTSKVCSVACGFAANTNGAFFALFSLSIAEKDINKANRIIYNTSFFFFALLSCVALYSLCFSEAIVHYWVGSDKFGGNWLLALIVLSNILYQVRSYFNNILYAGGFISLSAKRDMVWMFSYIILLALSISYIDIYAIPLSTAVTCLLFSGVYAHMIYKRMGILIKSSIFEFAKLIIITLPFIFIHFMLNMNYLKPRSYIAYFIIFSIAFFSTLFFSYKNRILQLTKKYKK